MLILREADIEPILKGLSVDQCQHLLQALWKSLAQYSGGRQGGGGGGGEQLIHQPMREVIVTGHKNTSLFMPASDTNTTTGIKIVTLPGSGGAPQGAINIFSPEGALRGVLNAEMITAFRTALAAMIPFHRYALPKKANIVVFGAGKQAEWHIRLSLLLAGDSISCVTVVNRGQKNLDILKHDLASVVTKNIDNIRFNFVSKESSASDYEGLLRDILSQADAIFCCTPSTEPLFPNSFLTNKAGPKNRFISLIGSYKPNMQEIDTDTLLSGTTVLVDSKEACLQEAGELIQARVQESQLTEIGEVPATQSLEGNIVFKCVGMGIMDLVIGSELLDLAQQRGVGVAIDQF